MLIPRAHLQGLILAGGAGTRAGGRDKGLIDYDGEPDVLRVAGSPFAPQVGAIWLSANRNQQEYARLGFAVIEDENPGFPGPLPESSVASPRPPHTG